MGKLAVVLLALASCTKSNSIECGNVFCSSTSVCNPAGDGCVLQTQVDACSGKIDDDGCTFPGASTAVCVTGVCTELGCGNKHIDKELGEACDDGNRISNDGCSSDCKSTEMCGDSIVDLALGEECDLGASNTDAFGTQCHKNCKRPRCGDMLPDPGELCDDGNNVPGDGCRADCGGRWTQMQSNTSASLNDVWALPTGEAWAVGFQGHLLHYDGATWTAVTGPWGLNVDLMRVWAASSSAIFILGHDGTNEAWYVYRYSGGAWTTTNFGSSASGDNWLALHGRLANDVWIVGYSSNATLAAISHFDGTNWTAQGVSGLNAAINQVYASADGSVFVTEYNSTAKVFQKSGSNWVSIIESGTTPLRALAIDGVSSTDVTVFANAASLRGGRHLANGAWQLMTHSEEAANNIGDLSVVPGQQTVVGAQGVTMVCDGSDCVLWPTPFTVTLKAVSAYAKDQAFIVGDYGTIFY